MYNTQPEQSGEEILAGIKALLKSGEAYAPIQAPPKTLIEEAMYPIWFKQALEQCEAMAVERGLKALPISNATWQGREVIGIYRPSSDVFEEFWAVDFGKLEERDGKYLLPRYLRQVRGEELFICDYLNRAAMAAKEKGYEQNGLG